MNWEHSVYSFIKHSQSMGLLFKYFLKENPVSLALAYAKSLKKKNIAIVLQLKIRNVNRGNYNYRPQPISYGSIVLSIIGTKHYDHTNL